MYICDNSNVLEPHSC